MSWPKPTNSSFLTESGSPFPAKKRTLLLAESVLHSHILQIRFFNILRTASEIVLLRIFVSYVSVFVCPSEGSLGFHHTGCSNICIMGNCLKRSMNDDVALLRGATEPDRRSIEREQRTDDDSEHSVCTYNRFSEHFPLHIMWKSSQ